METNNVKGGYNSSSQYKSTPLYEKPLFQKQTKMNLAEKILEHTNEGMFSKDVITSCSRCHHCR